MPRPKKYHTAEEKREAQREATRRSRAKKKGQTVAASPSSATSSKPKPKSWVRSLERKLSAVAADAVPGSDEKPPERTGEPFADLPPLDIVVPDAPSEGAGTDSSASDAATSSEQPSPEPKHTPSDGAKSPKPEGEIFDTAQLEAMATQIAHDGVMMMGTYAVERGYFALGEPFAKLAGVAAGVLVRVHAKNVGISDEEAAAWVLGGIVGVNGTQAFRAYREEQAKKKKEETAKTDGKQVHRSVPNEPGPSQNGVNAADAEGARAAQQRFAEQTKSAPVV